MSKVVCITGMHRSGTSLLAAWLETCGMIIHDGNIIGPSIGNPKGHFEDKDFVNLQTHAILLRHPKSDGWRVFEPSFMEFTPKQEECARALIDVRSARYNLWGWKDPRSVFFLPQWKKLMPSLKTVIVWRPCTDVADSLVKRSKRHFKNLVVKISLFQAVRLWKYSNECIYEYKVKYPDDTLLFRIDDILRDYRYVFSLINERFGLELAFRPIESVFEPNLIHRQTSFAVKAVAALYKSSKLESRLIDLSSMRVT